MTAGAEKQRKEIMTKFYERKRLGDIDKILSQNTQHPIDLFSGLPYNKSKDNIGNNTSPFRLKDDNTTNQLSGKGFEIKERVQSAFSSLHPESKNKDLFKDIDAVAIEKNIPLAESVVKKNMDSSPINRSTFKNLPYITDGLALFYAASEQGNYKAANAARKLAYTEVSQPISTDEDLPKRGESTPKKEESKYNGWDAASDILAIASIIPGVDTIADLASIPVDLIRGDYISAILSAIGAIPVVGEVADTAKLAKTADKIVDAAKGADKAIDAAKAVDMTTDAAKAAGKAADAAKTAKATKKITSVADNAESVAKEYHLGLDGFFGEKGKNVRIFKSDDPVKTSSDFYKKIGNGGSERILPNGKGVQTTFPDNSSVVYRVVTKTPNSPAIEITVEIPGMIKPQKIHFIKE